VHQGGAANAISFFWDGDDLLNERIEGANAARYAVLEGEMLSEKRGVSRYRFVPDPLGSVRALLDTSGSITATRDYWPYGEVAAQSGGMTALQFVGVLGYFTDTTNRIYVRARHYRPDLGRWVTEDPMGVGWGGWNSYGYASGSPEAATDHSGLQAQGPPSGDLTRTGVCDLLGGLRPSDISSIQRCFRNSISGLGIECDVPGPGGTLGEVIGRLRSYCQSGGPTVEYDDPSICCSLGPRSPTDPLPCARWRDDRTPGCVFVLCRDNIRDRRCGDVGGGCADMDRAIFNFLHEFLHCAGVSHGTVRGRAERAWQCNDVLACCINQVMYGRDAGCCRRRPI